MSNGDKPRQEAPSILIEHLRISHKETGEVLFKVAADRIEQLERELAESERMRMVEFQAAAETARPSLAPQESPLGWIVFVHADAQGYDYRIFADEKEADDVAGEDERNGEPVPLYRASAFPTPLSPLAPTVLPWSPEETAKRFHVAYEKFAPLLGWETQEVSRVPWEKLPQNQRDLMIAVVRNVLIEQGQAALSHIAPSRPERVDTAELVLELHRWSEQHLAMDVIDIIEEAQALMNKAAAALARPVSAPPSTPAPFKPCADCIHTPDCKALLRCKLAVSSTVAPIVELRDIVIGDGPGWLVWLRIGNQTFTIGDAHEAKDEAEWSADMLRKALARLSATAAPVWVPVSKQMPEYAEKVLACWSDGFIYCAMHSTVGWLNSANERAPNQDVTHWMPLPSGPVDVRHSDG